MTADAVLVADIGGTNARFAVAEPAGAGWRVSDKHVFRAEDYEAVADAAHAYLETLARPAPTRAAFAVAAPVDGPEVAFTNSPWAFRREGLARALGLSAFHVLNDFEAQARGLAALPAEALTALKPGAGEADAPRVVFGPGTGLGLSLVVPGAPCERIVSTEGGHAAFAPQTDEEIEILKFIRNEHDFVSWERVLSGRGLVNIHRALCVLAGAPRVNLTPGEIAEAALTDRLPIARRAVETFCALLGGFAGDAVLTTGARGGAFIAGGIAPRLLPILARSAFVDRFCARGPMSAYMTDIPVSVVTADDAAFIGAARALAESRS